MDFSLSIGIIIGNNWVFVDPRTCNVWVKSAPARVAMKPTNIFVPRRECVVETRLPRVMCELDLGQRQADGNGGDRGPGGARDRRRGLRVGVGGSAEGRAGDRPVGGEYGRWIPTL